MKKFASILVCVLCVMFASVIRHAVLSKTVPAAAEYSRWSCSAAAEVQPEAMNNAPHLHETV